MKKSIYLLLIGVLFIASYLATPELSVKDDNVNLSLKALSSNANAQEEFHNGCIWSDAKNRTLARGCKSAYGWICKIC